MLVEREHADRDEVEQLGERAAEPERDDEPEGLPPDHADDELDAVAGVALLLDEEARRA